MALSPTVLFKYTSEKVFVESRSYANVLFQDWLVYNDYLEILGKNEDNGEDLMESLKDNSLMCYFKDCNDGNSSPETTSAKKDDVGAFKSVRADLQNSSRADLYAFN